MVLMPARKVIFAPNQFYHVYNRGSEKRIIFLSTRDYSKFLQRTKENAKKFAIDILCYCLMPNHFHFLLKQNSNISTMSFMNALQLGYAKYFNTKYERIGPLFQGRFKAKIIETDEYLLQLSAYIHLNPIAEAANSENPQDSGDLIQKLRDFPHSSYREYLGVEKPDISSPAFILDYFSKNNPNFSYRKFVENFSPDSEIITPLTLEY